MIKKAAMGEGMLMMFRILLVTFTAFIILGLSAIFYDYYINIRQSEAQIMSKQVINCIAPLGFFDSEKITGKDIFDFCGIKNTKRFFVKIELKDRELNTLQSFSGGDSGSAWLVEFLRDSANKEKTESIKKYLPEEELVNYPVVFIRDGEKFEGILNTEVVVSHEF